MFNEAVSERPPYLILIFIHILEEARPDLQS